MCRLLFRVPRPCKAIGRQQAGIPHDDEEVHVWRDMGRGAGAGGADGGVHCCGFQVQSVHVQESEGRAQTPPALCRCSQMCGLPERDHLTGEAGGKCTPWWRRTAHCRAVSMV